MKRYCKATLNVFFNKKIFGDDKFFFIYMIIFLSQTEILLLNMLKLLKIPGFSSFFFLISQIPGYFCLNCQIPGFSRIPGKVATLILILLFNKYENLSLISYSWCNLFFWLFLYELCYCGFEDLLETYWGFLTKQ